jgi:hypothetical protein
VTLPLSYRGAARPAAVRSGSTPGQRRAVFGLLLAATVALYVAFRRREAALGRFAPLPPPGAVDQAWLERNVFTLLPEEVGALGTRTSARRRAAVLARLAAEKKIKTKTEGKKLTLRLLAPLDQFSGYDRDFDPGLPRRGTDPNSWQRSEFMVERRKKLAEARRVRLFLTARTPELPAAGGVIRRIVRDFYDSPSSPPRSPST